MCSDEEGCFALVSLDFLHLRSSLYAWMSGGPWFASALLSMSVKEGRSINGDVLKEEGGRFDRIMLIEIFSFGLTALFSVLVALAEATMMRQMRAQRARCDEVRDASTRVSEAMHNSVREVFQ